MIPETINSDWGDLEICRFASKWIIDERVAVKLVMMASRLPFGIQIISGYRTAERQKELERDGRPTAPDHLSTHRSCPATGVDVLPTVAVSRIVKATLGEAAVVAGFRWGGGSPVDGETGIPSDWNHFDLGPRSQTR